MNWPDLLFNIFFKEKEGIQFFPCGILHLNKYFLPDVFLEPRANKINANDMPGPEDTSLMCEEIT